MQSLDVLIGEWTIEVVHPQAEYNGVTGRQRFESVLDGKFVLQRATVDNPYFPDSVSVLGAGQAHYFDTRGVVRTLHLSLENGVWKLWREDPDFWQRFTGTFNADRTEINGTFEMSHDEGANWQHDFDIIYRKVTPAQPVPGT